MYAFHRIRYHSCANSYQHQNYHLRRRHHHPTGAFFFTLWLSLFLSLFECFSICVIIFSFEYHPFHLVKKLEFKASVRALVTATHMSRVICELWNCALGEQRFTVYAFKLVFHFECENFLPFVFIIFRICHRGFVSIRAFSAIANSVDDEDDDDGGTMILTKTAFLFHQPTIYHQVDAKNIRKMLKICHKQRALTHISARYCMYCKQSVNKLEMRSTLFLLLRCCCFYHSQYVSFAFQHTIQPICNWLLRWRREHTFQLVCMQNSWINKNFNENMIT